MYTREQVIDEFNEFSTKVKKNKTPINSLFMSGPLAEKQVRNEKNPNFCAISRPMFTTVDQDKFSLNLSYPEDGCITGQVLSKPKELYERDEKKTEFNIISEKESLDECMMENPNTTNTINRVNPN